MRIEGWEGLLNEHIEQARHVEFEWGMNDCALWAADWVKKANGNDFASAWRGLYSSEAELEQLMAERELELPADIADDVGLPQMHVGFAQRGDIVQHPQGCLGICNGMHSYFLMERGVTRLRTKDCVKAWRVG
ncbi:hypothetical protein J8F10_08840 [Gemmata sp. G18]|uniref:DUF6950 domain-containing protein n=1 Tax=Gemmata palustris TaxID=2822762 RepID=A0ABS5BQ06_9BACT|nr:hypothetical protein [Gemmata palustris]MBP3955385.1 hypothetical protein [Gemmata palustris]